MPFDPQLGSGSVRLTFFGEDEVHILARNADRAPAERRDPADDFLVDLARKHHLNDLGGRGIGDAQPADEGRFDPELLQHCADLRAAAVHDDRIDADRLQQHDILSEVALRLGVAHRMTAIFDHESLAGITLKIGTALRPAFRPWRGGRAFSRGIGHRHHPAFFASRLRPSATRPVITKGMTRTDSVTLASICPPIRLAIGNTP